MVNGSSLEKKNNSNSNNRYQQYKKMFLLEPLTIIRGTICALFRKSGMQDFQSLNSKEYDVVIQETSRKRLEPGAGAETKYMATAEKWQWKKNAKRKRK